MRAWSGVLLDQDLADAVLELGVIGSHPPHAAHDAFPAGRLGDPRHATTSSPRDDERPAVALGSRHLRVHEHILHLLRAAREPVARPAGADDETRRASLSSRHGPAARPRPRAAAVVLAHGPHAAAEVGAASCRRATRGARRASPRARAGAAARSSASARRFALGARMEPSQQRQDLVADQPALRVGGSTSRRGTRAPCSRAVRLRLVAPEREQRAHDAVLAARLDRLASCR